MNTKAFKNSKREPVIYLGTLDLQVRFRLASGARTIYKTITYGPSTANPKHGKRGCINMNTFQGIEMACSSIVTLVD